MLVLFTALLAAPAPAQGAYAETRRMLPPIAGIAEGMGVVADVNGDGFADALFVTGYGDVLLYGSATTEFTDGSADLPDFGPGNTSVALGDLDGDGLPEAVVGSSGAPTAVYANAGGVLAPQAVIGTTKEVSDVKLADLDGDGDLDLVVASADDVLPNEVWLGDGAGHLAPHAGAFAGLTHALTDSIAVADFDGDGFADLYLSERTAPDELLLGSAAATFSPAPGSPLPLGTYEADAGDLDADGDADVTVNAFQNDLMLGLNGGGGAFAFSPIDPGWKENAFSELTFDDVDVDGLDDLLVTGYLTGFYRSLGASGFVDAKGELDGAPYGRAAVGDLDGDQDLDLVIGGSALQLRGPGAFHDYGHHFGQALDLTGGAVVGDLDGDGDDDVVSRAGNVYLSDGAGDLVPGTPAPFGGTAIADVDGDGDADLLLPTILGVSIGLNQGPASFVDGGYADGTHGAFDVVAGDVDSDGDVDLFVTTDVAYVFLFGYPYTVVRLNDGTGAFPAAGSSDVAAILSDAELADVDGDGDPDLLFTGADSGAARNDGAGGFTTTGAFVPPGLNAAYLATGDVDADGDLDAVFTRLEGDLLFLNDGSGTLSPAPPGMLPSTPGPGSEAVLADADGDGDLDLLTLGPEIRYYAGDGTGAFTGPEIVYQPPFTGVAPVSAPIDLDLDGDLDVVASGQAVTGAFVHVGGGQTARHTPPRIGKPLEMQAFGPAGTPFTLAVAPFAASIPLAPYGTLGLDPATVKVVATGTIPPDGRAAVQIAVPNVPPLIGATVYWQSLVGAPMAFTNAEPMTLTAD